MPSHKTKLLSKTKSRNLRISSFVFLSLIITLSVSLPCFATQVPSSQHLFSREALLFTTIWLIAITPSLFFVGWLVGSVYYYRGWKAEKLAKENVEKEKTREGIMARFSQQYIVASLGGDESPVGITTIDLLDIQKPEKAAARFSSFQNGWKKSAQQFERVNGKGRGRRKVEEDEMVLWDVEEHEVSMITTEIIERRNGAMSRETEGRWVDDPERGMAGREVV